MLSTLAFSRALVRSTLASLAVAAATGCSTPQAALDQANQTTKLMSQLQSQIDQFHSVMNAAEQARLDSIESQRQVLEGQQMSAKLEDITKKSAGDTVEGPMREKLLAAADFIGGVDSTFDKQHQADHARLSKLLAPLPSTAASMNAAQIATAKMGAELSLDSRLSELAAAAKDIKSSVKDDLDKLKQAKTTAAAKNSETADAATAEAASAK